MQFFRPLLAGAQWRDRLIAAIGALLGIALTMVIGMQLPAAGHDLPLIVAPIGASAVLAFAVPTSPLAQPWPVIGGNVISTLVGVAIYHAVPHVPLAAGLAVGAAIAVMSLLRCLHPPGGAAAMSAVLATQSIHDAGYWFALAPVGINSVLLVMLAMLFHRLSGHSYPHRPAVSPQVQQATQQAAGFHLTDIDHALADMHESFDISREDLDLLLSRAELHAEQRRQRG